MEENVSCIICGKYDFSNYLNLKDRLAKLDKSFLLVKCKCSFIYLNPRPDKLSIAKYYNNNNYEPHILNQSFQSFLYRIIQKIAFNWKLYLIKRSFSKDKGKLLDIGGGRGDFGMFMYEKSWSVTIQDEFYTNNQNKCIKYIKDLNNLNEDHRYDVITLWHSLEHIHNIDELFKNIKRLLKNNGSLIIAVPNIDATEKKYFNECWAPYDAPRHLYHFNFRTLNELCKRYKLNINRRYSLYQDTPYNILLSMNDYNIFKYIYILILSLISVIKIILLGPRVSSSFLIVCKKTY